MVLLRMSTRDGVRDGSAKLRHANLTNDLSNNLSKLRSLIMSEQNERSSSGTQILLRLTPEVAATLRSVAKKEERTITAVALRALREYFKQNHQIEL